MYKNFGAKPYLFPQPVMMLGTYDADGKPNLMNAAWGGIVDMNKLIVDLGSHKTTDNIAVTGAWDHDSARLRESLEKNYPGVDIRAYEPPATMSASSRQKMSRISWQRRASPRAKANLSTRP